MSSVDRYTPHPLVLFCIRTFLFSLLGATWVHKSCAAWSDGVVQSEDMTLLNVDKAVFSGKQFTLSRYKFHN